MRTRFCLAAVLAVTVMGSAAAQAPPEPLAMGVPYAYQPGNPSWYVPLAAPTVPPLYAYPSYYPFGASGNVFGRYSWDYNVYGTYGPGGRPNYLPQPPYWVASYPTYSWPTYYPPVTYYNYAWKGFAN